MNSYDIIIIGGGISGLSLAHYCLKDGLQPLVIEKQNQTGGTFHTHVFVERETDFWAELGAHTAYNSYGHFIGLLEDLGIADRIIPRQKLGYQMLVDNVLQSIPSRLSFGELLFSLPRFVSLKKAGMSIEAYYTSVFGKKNFERILGPVFSAVICQKAHDFPADLLFKKRPRRKNILKSFTFDKGIQTVTSALAAEHGLETVTGMDVTDISAEGDSFIITTASGETYTCKTLALATPAPVAASLLRKALPETSDAVSRVGAETVESAAVLVRKDSLSLKPLAGIVPVQDVFHSVVSRDTVIHQDYRGFTFHFKPGITDKTKKVKRISDVLGIRSLQIEAFVQKDNMVPSLTVDHPSVINKIDRSIAGKRLLLTGNYFAGLAIEDCVARSLSEYHRLKKLGKG